MNEPEHVVEVPLRWRDIDLLGHVYNGRYHEWLEEARAEVFAEIAGPMGYPFVIASVTVNFRHEVTRPDGPIRIVTQVASVGEKSAVLDHEMFRSDGKLVADAKSVMVACDRDAHVSRKVSDAERRMLGV